MSEVQPQKQGGWGRRILIGGAGLVGFCVVCLICTVAFANSDVGQALLPTRTPGRFTAAAQQTAVSATEAAGESVTEPDSPTEVPEATEGPAATPEPPTATSEPTVTPEPTAAPEPIPFSGSGSNITDDFVVPASVWILDASHTGDFNFIVQLYDADTAELEDLVINGLGPYTGSGLVALDTSKAYYFDVISDGTWEMTLRPPDYSTGLRDLPMELSGEASTVTLPLYLQEGRVNLTYSHDGEFNFIGTLFSLSDGDMEELAINELGAVSDKRAAMRVAEEGWYVLEIVASGDWKIVVEE